MERFRQTKPKVVISANAVYYNGKSHQLQEKLELILTELTTVKHAIIIPFLKDSNEPLKAFPQENWYTLQNK